MRYSDAVSRLQDGGAGGWDLYVRARAMIAAGADVVELAIGEPDVPTPPSILEATVESLRNGRTAYADGAGEPVLREALARRYSERADRPIGTDQVLALAGTQNALYTAVRTVAGPGDGLIVSDPLYATYLPVAAAAGADVQAVPLRPENGFRISADDIAAAVTPTTTAILLNSPHNPTGAVLTEADVRAIGEVAVAHDLWLVADEVYEDLVFPGTAFFSPLWIPELADRVVVLNSISKSHAAPGFRSGWCVASAEFCSRAQTLSEAVLFGGQPFIADATAVAVSLPSPVAAGMIERFAKRADVLHDRLHAETELTVHRPDAGMFALVNVSTTGMTGAELANDLLDNGGVAVMPGSSFGSTLDDWLRIALTRADDLFDEGCRRMIAHVQGLNG